MTTQIVPVPSSMEESATYSLVSKVCDRETESSYPSVIHLCLIIGLANLCLSMITYARILKFKTSLQTMENHAYASGKSLISMIDNMKTALAGRENDDTKLV